MTFPRPFRTGYLLITGNFTHCNVTVRQTIYKQKMKNSTVSVSYILQWTSLARRPGVRQRHQKVKVRQARQGQLSTVTRHITRRHLPCRGPMNHHRVRPLSFSSSPVNSYPTPAPSSLSLSQVARRTVIDDKVFSRIVNVWFVVVKIPRSNK